MSSMSEQGDKKCQTIRNIFLYIFFATSVCVYDLMVNICSWRGRGRERERRGGGLLCVWQCVCDYLCSHF